MLLPSSFVQLGHRKFPKRFFGALLCAFLPLSAFAATPPSLDAYDPPSGAALSMTIMPPLFQLTLAPGATWSSLIDLTNGNPYDLALTVFTENFSASDQSGAAVFAGDGQPPTDCVLHELCGAGVPNAHELATWITLPSPHPYAAKGKTARIPFTINVPKDAEPGGHYAAILIGSDPGKAPAGSASVSTLMSSLFFVRITGDVVESGTIRDFSAAHNFVGGQHSTFKVQFYNTGNVHLSPKGTITIFNMFGQERGKVAIDEKNTFGTVLPGANRAFTFAWKGESNFFDIGLYSAVAELSYGNQEKKTLTAKAHFLVIPVIPIIVIVLALSFFVRFGGRALRRYVQEAIRQEEERIAKGGKPHAQVATTFAVLKEPIKRGIEELKQVSGLSIAPIKTKHDAEAVGTYTLFLQKYRAFFIAMFIILLGFMSIAWYFFQVFESERSFEIVITKEGGHDVVLPATSTPSK